MKRFELYMDFALYKINILLLLLLSLDYVTVPLVETYRNIELYGKCEEAPNYPCLSGRCLGYSSAHSLNCV